MPDISPTSVQTIKLDLPGGYPSADVSITPARDCKATMVVVPGWNSSPDRPLFVRMRNALTREGVTTLGYQPAYNTDPSNLNIDRVTAELKAVQACSKEFSPQTILLGASLGAFAIGSFLAQNPDYLPRAIILRGGAPRSKKFGEPTDPNVFQALARIPCPVLILHGTADDVISPSLALELHNARTQSGLPSELVLQEGYGHVVEDRQIDPIIQSVNKFLTTLF